PRHASCPAGVQKQQYRLAGVKRRRRSSFHCFPGPEPRDGVDDDDALSSIVTHRRDSAFITIRVWGAICMHYHNEYSPRAALLGTSGKPCNRGLHTDNHGGNAGASLQRRRKMTVDTGKPGALHTLRSSPWLPAVGGAI
ncbi:hypothetical protein MRX96_054069, partial [Rhipicephalus microplus]